MHPARRIKVRVGLADLIGWVLAAGVSASVCRGMLPDRRTWRPISTDHLLGMTAAFLAIASVLALLRQAEAMQRRRRTRGDVPRSAVAWRLLATAMLGVLLVVQVEAWDGPQADDAFEVMAQRQLLPVALTLAMAGVLAGLSPGRVGPRKGAWLSAVWAWAAGLALAATQVLPAYLVLLALEAVSAALYWPSPAHRARPGLHDRMIRVGLEAAPALACSLALALGLSRALRRPDDRAGGRAGILWLLAGTVAMAACTAWLVSVTIPRVHEYLAEGLRMALGPRVALALALGLAGLALGLAARAADRPEATGEERPGRSLRGWVLRLAVVLVLLDVIFARTFAAFGPIGGFGAIRVGWTDMAFEWLRAIAPTPRWFVSSAPGVRTSIWGLFEMPKHVVVAAVQVWVAWRLVALLLAPAGTGPTPIDANLADRRSFARFAARWLALTVLLVGAIPALGVAGLVLLHALFRGP